MSLSKLPLLVMLLTVEVLRISAGTPTILPTVFRISSIPPRRCRNKWHTSMSFPVLHSAVVLPSVLHSMKYWQNHTVNKILCPFPSHTGLSCWIMLWTFVSPVPWTQVRKLMLLYDQQLTHTNTYTWSVHSYMFQLPTAIFRDLTPIFRV